MSAAAKLDHQALEERVDRALTIASLMASHGCEDGDLDRELFDVIRSGGILLQNDLLAIRNLLEGRDADEDRVEEAASDSPADKAWKENLLMVLSNGVCAWIEATCGAFDAPIGEVKAAVARAPAEVRALYEALDRAHAIVDELDT